jgi:hypothetical protein
MAAIAAVLGLAFLGNTLTKDDPNCKKVTIEKGEVVSVSQDTGTVLTSRAELATAQFPDNPTIRANRWAGKEATRFVTPSTMASREVHGQPVYNFDDRQGITNKMNNVNPNPWMRVGPGLGIPSDVPAYGGHQQLLRVLPTNTNEYRLTTLPGRSGGPPKNLVPTQEATMRMDKNRPEKDFYRGPTETSVIAKAPEARGRYIKGVRWTKRDVSMFRDDDLQYGAPQQVKPLNSAYVITGNQTMDRCDRRAKPDRPGNAGRMNVRADPLGAHGAVTSVRVDSLAAKVAPPGQRVVPENYLRVGLQQANPFKENQNFMANDSSLSIAKRQLAGNPMNHSIN